MSETYFNDAYAKENQIVIDRKLAAMDKRKRRTRLPGFSKRAALRERPKVAQHFTTGDIINVSFKNQGKFYMFSGICLSIRKKSFKSPTCTVVLRNVILSVGVELTFSLFSNRAYRLQFSNFQRKDFYYNKSKLNHLRYGNNKKTQSHEIL